jgi:hypothetical protein
MKKMKERQINNSFQIVEEFTKNPCGPFVPRSWKMNNLVKYNQHGPVKIYTEEEIFLYKIRQAVR